MALPLKEQLSIILPVFNEELHLPRLLKNLSVLDINIFVVDSGSADKTIEIAEAAGCAVAVGAWGSFSEKLNWAVANSPYRTPWVMRVDADEWLSEELIQTLGRTDFSACGCAAFKMNRRVYFLGRWIKHGGMYPYAVARIFQPASAYYENRFLDEHLVVTGNTGYLVGDFADEPLYPLAHWLRKLVGYAETACYEEWNGKEMEKTWRKLVGVVKFRRFLKEEVYEHLPTFLRAFIYWFYRYFILFGFLDGFPGLALHTLHAFWYRFTIDTMLYEAKLTNGKSVKAKHTN